MNTKDILIVDDHCLIYEGLKTILQQYRLVHASSGNEAQRLLQERVFYACILDITLGTENGFDLARTLIRENAGTIIFFLSMHDTPLFIKQAMDLGARGYFLKDESLALVTAALERPDDRRFWISERGTVQLDKHIAHEDTLYELLTRREQQIFRLLAEGMNYKEIAAVLGISPKTVNVHRSQLMAKLLLSSQNDLLRLAVKLEIVTL